MADLWEFKSPEWINKERELLRFANYNCEEGCDEQAKKAYVCYYLEGVSIYNLPKDAYKCYCPRHWERRHAFEHTLRIKLAALTVLDLDTLCRVLDDMARIPRGKRAEIMEQLYVEAKAKHARQGAFMDDTATDWEREEDDFED